MTEEAQLEGGEASEGPQPANPAAISIALSRKSSPGATAVDEEAAANHDPQSAQLALQPIGSPDDTSFLQADAISAFTALPGYWLAAERGDWRAALNDAEAADAWLENHKVKLPVMELMQSVWIRPLEALAMAKEGDIDSAETLIEKTPADCCLCLRARRDRFFEA